MSTTTEGPKDRILRLLEARKLTEARPLCEAWLAGSDTADAWRILGVIAGREGKLPEAERCFREAVARDPADTKALSNLAHALRTQNKLVEAADAYRAVLSREDTAPLRFTLADILTDWGELAAAETEFRNGLAAAPDDVPARYNLGWVCQQQGRIKEARECYEQVLARDPHHAHAMNNLGLLLLADAEYAKARGLFERVTALQPDFAPAWRNLGQALMALGHLDEAVAALERSIQLGSDAAEAWNDIGLIRARQGRNKEAVECFERALRLKPKTETYIHLARARYIEGSPELSLAACDNVLATDQNSAEAHQYKGLALKALNRLDEAEQSYRQAIALKPDYAEAHYNLGYLYHNRGRGRLREAETCYRQALAIRPAYASARLNLGSVIRDAGRIEEALEWLSNEHAPDARLATLNYSADTPRETIAAAHREWGERWGYTRADLGLPGNDPDPERRLRIAYLSPDLRDHSVAYFIEPVLQHHDKTRFEVFAYTQFKEAKPDEVSERLRGYCDHWIETKDLGDLDLARRIREDGIDVVIELAGHTADNRLQALAYRPAPVQVTYLGYCNTTGLPAMDYRLTDAWADPPGQEAFHTEQLVRLAGGFLCYQPPDDAPVSELPARSTGFITFGSFNNFSKFTPHAVELWARLMHSLPGSRLILKNKSLSDAGAGARCAALFGAQGIDPARLELIGWLPSRQEHLGLYSRIDIGLDTFPYNGTTTTCEALWMGVPVISLAGDRHAGRVGVSLLSRLGLPELIAETPEQYIEIARGVSMDPMRLTELRRGLRQRMLASSLCDATAFTRALEQTYRELWRRWCGGATAR